MLVPKEEILLMQKDGVKVQQRMDSKKEDFLNLRLNLSMTRSTLNPKEKASRDIIAGVLEGVG